MGRRKTGTMLLRDDRWYKIYGQWKKNTKGY